MVGVTIDTNVLASGFLGFKHPERAPSQLIRLWLADLFALILSEAILHELGRTLADPYFQARMSQQDRADAISLLRSSAIITPMTVAVRGVATHPEDDTILATALSGKADYLVSGDRQLQRLGTYQGVTIISPRDFVETIVPELRSS